ncbi:hypothetical protein O7627_07560 [Solwaraspora sp. WMMD1047]|uniref:hypothetical protein n=1 Tax=Solwaraspora sp. WMMD1047 TaxID=3016102 RepID=UPI0024168170|nr:hypothetical protein [Solwaraspora sp. WMMD1047]MDG4829162.1 hypothetical protein [Solwaraspora sp. WMMD1047]
MNIAEVKATLRRGDLHADDARQTLLRVLVHVQQAESLALRTCHDSEDDLVKTGLERLDEALSWAHEGVDLLRSAADAAAAYASTL